jgi:hypothetical protein
MSIETLRFLRDLLARQQISAEEPNIQEFAALIFSVRQELDQAIKESTSVLPHAE